MSFNKDNDEEKTNYHTLQCKEKSFYMTFKSVEIGATF